MDHATFAKLPTELRECNGHSQRDAAAQLKVPKRSLESREQEQAMLEIIQVKRKKHQS